MVTNLIHPEYQRDMWFNYYAATLCCFSLIWEGDKYQPVSEVKTGQLDQAEELVICWGHQQRIFINAVQHFVSSIHSLSHMFMLFIN